MKTIKYCCAHCEKALDHHPNRYTIQYDNGMDYLCLSCFELEEAAFQKSDNSLH